MSLPATRDEDGRPIILEVYRGDTFRRTLTFSSLVDGVSVPYVLPTTGWSAQIRSYADAVTPLGSFTVDSTGGATGVIVVSLPAETTETMSDGVFDLQVVATDTTTYLRGTVKFTRDVTRA